MKASELKDRTQQFAVDILRLSKKLPNTVPGRAVAQPMLRAGTAVGSNYRHTCKSRNQYDFMHGIGFVEEATDETSYWLELAREGELLKADDVEPLIEEAKALKKILLRSRRTAEKRFKERTKTFGSDGEDVPF